MISAARMVSKSMKNREKSSLECFGTPKSRQRSAGLAGLAARVANVGPMGGSGDPNGGPGRGGDRRSTASSAPAQGHGEG